MQLLEALQKTAEHFSAKAKGVAGAAETGDVAAQLDAQAAEATVAQARRRTAEGARPCRMLMALVLLRL